MLKTISNIIGEITPISVKNEIETNEIKKNSYSLQLTAVKYVLYNNLFIPAMEIKSLMSGNTYTNLMEWWIVIKCYNEKSEVQNNYSFEMDIREKIDCLQSLVNENNALIIGILGNKLLKFTVHYEDVNQIDDFVFLGLELGLNHIIIIKFDNHIACSETNEKLDQDSMVEFIDLTHLRENIREILEQTTIDVNDVIDKIRIKYQIKTINIEQIKLEDLYWKDSSVNDVINEKKIIFYTVKEYLIGTLLFAKGPIWGLKLANVIYFVDMTALCRKLLFNFEDGFI